MILKNQNYSLELIFLTFVDFFYKSEAEVSSFFKQIVNVGNKDITAFGKITDFTRRKNFFYFILVNFRGIHPSAENLLHIDS